MPLVSEARAFLTELAANNSKPWFDAHKAEYEAKLKAPALALLDRLSGPVAEIAGGPVETKLWRPYRDVRFSKDKTPYHTHLHMAWLPSGAGRQAPGFFFGISKEYVTCGVGLMGFDKGVTDDWRAGVDRDGRGWQGEIDALLATGFTLGEPDLKRVPAPYGKDHPHGDLLRRKGLALWSEVTSPDPEAELLDRFGAARGLIARLRDLV